LNPNPNPNPTFFEVLVCFGFLNEFLGIFGIFWNFLHILGDFLALLVLGLGLGLGLGLADRVRFRVRVMGWENHPIDAQAHPSSKFKLL